MLSDEQVAQFDRDGFVVVPDFVGPEPIAELRARAIELGVNDYLGKPYQDSQLLDAIRRQLEDRGIELP